MTLDHLYKLAIGTAGGAAIEGIDQAAQVAAPAVAAATGSDDPIELVKLITQLVVALATVISLFVKPRAKQRQADQAPDAIQPLRVLDLDEKADQPTEEGDICTFKDCPWPESCGSRCIYPKGTDERIRDFRRY